MQLYYFPPSTYSQKALIALEEKNVSFEREIVNLFDDQVRAEYREFYPLGKIPLLKRDDGWIIPESSIIVEFLDTEYPDAHSLIPSDPTLARQTRFMDRMNDLYLNDSVATLLFESWKPNEEQDKAKIEGAQAQLTTMYEYMNKNLVGKDWLVEDFSMADCAAAPALLYAQQVFPFTGNAEIERYWQNLSQRKSIAAVFEHAQPYIDNLGKAAA